MHANILSFALAASLSNVTPLCFLLLLRCHFLSPLSSIATLLLPAPLFSTLYLQQCQFPARPRGLFPVCPGAGGNLSRETNCSVSASCEHLAQPGMLSRGYTSGDRVQPPTYADMCTLASTQQTCTWTTYTLTPVLPSALYNHGPQGNVM